MNDPIVLAFPAPDGPELRRAFLNLYLATDGDEATKKALGNPIHLPRPWDPPSCTQPALRAELWDWLERFVAWFNHEYVWDHTAGMIPTCWPQHPHLVHEIAVLADQRRRASIDTTSSSLEEWHRYCVPAFLDRLKTRIKQSCDEQHSRWPAASRYARYVGDVQRRVELFMTDAGPAPAAPVRAPRFPRLVDPDTGQTIDRSTGELL